VTQVELRVLGSTKIEPAIAGAARPPVTASTAPVSTAAVPILRENEYRRKIEKNYAEIDYCILSIVSLTILTSNISSLVT
jgi:hypothetical protein